MVRRPRDAPAETALDRADVDDRLGAAVAVRGVVLPGRDPFLHGREHLVQPQDRVLVALALAERRVDEVAVRPDPEPQRSRSGRARPCLRSAPRAGTCRRRRRGRRGSACRPRSRGTGRPARRRTASSRSRRQTAAIITSPASRTPASCSACTASTITRERALHVRDPEAVEAAVLDEVPRLEPGNVAQPLLATRVRRVHVAVEHQRLAAARAGPRADRVRPAVLHLLPLDAEIRAAR